MSAFSFPGVRCAAPGFGIQPLRGMRMDGGLHGAQRMSNERKRPLTGFARKTISRIGGSSP
jgi:hypothetical protein